MKLPEKLDQSRGKRLNKLHSIELIKLSGDNPQSEFRVANDLIQINYAHIIMLKEQGLITEQEAGAILKCLQRVDKEGAEKVVPLDFRVGDLFTCLESHIISVTGMACGGKINIGRSRNDTYATLTKMDLRSASLRIYQALITFAKSLLELSREHRETVMPGYTHHSRHAQPITLGYYFLGNFEVIQRNLLRLEDLWPRLNTCPMGAAALATTGFSLNRERMADLLGFDIIHEHAYDAISSKDYMLEFLFILATIASDIGRIAENLLLWSTFEFDMVELADEHTSFSSIMPQKKNAVALECIRAYNPIVTGKLMNAFGILKAMPWSNGREITLLIKDYSDTAEKVENMLVMLNSVVDALTVKREVMQRWARLGFSTTTELADTLVRDYGFPFRVAHEIVGQATKQAIDQGLDALGIDSHMLEYIIVAHTGKKMNIDPEKVKAALEPMHNVQARNLPGGPAPAEVRRMIHQRRLDLEKRSEFLTQNKAKLDQSRRDLLNLVDAAIGATGSV